MTKARVYAAIRWVWALLFLSTGALKLLDPAAFADAISHYQLLPAWIAVITALLVPWLEIACGFALLSRRLLGGGLVISVCLSLGFAGFTGSALIRQLDIDCGCFGTQSATGHLPWTFLLDILMLTSSIWATRYYLYSFEVPRRHEGDSAANSLL